MSRIFDGLIKTDLAGVLNGAGEPRQPGTPAVPNSHAGHPGKSPGAAQSVLTGPVEPRVDISAPDIRRVDLAVSAFTPVFPFEDEHSDAAEQYRLIRTKILHHPKAPKTLVISSGSSGDGKTITAINLAASLALKSATSVLLIDADLRRPRVANALGLEGPGLTDVISGRCSLDEALCCPNQLPNLCILTAGTPTTNPVELLDSDQWRLLMQEVRRRFSSTVLDTTPVALVADYDLVQLQSDGVILVARPDHSARSVTFKALELVPKDKLIGVVLNCVEDWFLWKVESYGLYGYRYGRPD